MCSITQTEYKNKSMKNYKGTCKVKDDSTYIYKGKTLKITGIYQKYENGSGMGVFPDGARSYKLCLIGMGFEYTSTVIEDKHLENIELFECIDLPFNREEVLLFAEFCSKNNLKKANDILTEFLEESKKPSIIPKHDLSTLY